MDDRRTANDHFEVEIHKFMKTAKGLRQTTSFIMILLYERLRKATSDLADFFKQHREERPDEADKVADQVAAAERWIASLSRDDFRKLRVLTVENSDAELATRVVPASLLVSLVSQFDTYFAHLVQSMFRAQPALLNASDRTIKLSDLLTYPSIEEAKQAEIDKEVERLLRGSHDEMFDWLEKKLNMSIRDKLTEWPQFVELTERRNLFVHTDGRVSQQYLEQCKKHNFTFAEPPQLGDELEIKPAYFSAIVDCARSVAVELAYIIWRKLSSADDEIDSCMNNIALDLIKDREYDLALTILEFIQKVPKRKSSQEIQLIMLVNTAQCYKWKHEDNKCQALLAQTDWSAFDAKFKLARSVLSGDLKLSADLMKKAAGAGDIQREQFAEWPLFKEFRTSTEFQVTYKELYGEEYCESAIQLMPSSDAILARVLEAKEQEAATLLTASSDGVGDECVDAQPSEGNLLTETNTGS